MTSAARMNPGRVNGDRRSPVGRSSPRSAARPVVPAWRVRTRGTAQTPKIAVTAGAATPSRIIPAPTLPSPDMPSF
jgi:hypothetical protein